MAGPYKITEYGQVGSGTREYVLDISGGSDVEIPANFHPRYFKSDIDCTLKVRLVNGASSFNLPVVKGINVEAIREIFVSGSCASAVIVFFE